MCRAVDKWAEKTKFSPVTYPPAKTGGPPFHWKNEDAAEPYWDIEKCYAHTSNGAFGYPKGVF